MHNQNDKNDTRVAFMALLNYTQTKLMIKQAKKQGIYALHTKLSQKTIIISLLCLFIGVSITSWIPLKNTYLQKVPACSLPDNTYMFCILTHVHYSTYCKFLSSYSLQAKLGPKSSFPPHPKDSLITVHQVLQWNHLILLMLQDACYLLHKATTSLSNPVIHCLVYRMSDAGGYRKQWKPSLSYRK